jgi:MoxR-like ATPase
VSQHGPRVTALQSAEDVRRGFDDHGYLADQGMSTAVYLALQLGLPLLLEGEPGVGKTAAAKVLASTLGVPLIRLQCYEGLSASEALFDWNYQRQLLAIRVAESQHHPLQEADLFAEEYLL